MTFDIRCKTPAGPFSSPELLDIKAPPAVHTAQSRVNEWSHRDLISSTLEPVQSVRASGRQKPGPAQYEALLQELLVSAGCAQLPADQPSHKRLACHVTLLKQLLQAGVFGPLQNLVEAVLNELLSNALSPQIAADPATGAERLVAAHSREIHRVPYYQLAAQAQQSLVEQQQQSSQALQQQADAAATASKASVAAMQERHDVEAAELQKLSEKLEEQLKVANDQIARSESAHASSVAQHIKRLEDKEKEVGKWREQLEAVQQQLDRVHVAQQEAEEEEAVLQQLKLACLLPPEQDHEAAALHQLSEAIVLEQQLGVVLNAKLEEYEESRHRGTAASNELGHEHARYRTEADAIMQQLVALKQYINNYIQLPTAVSSQFSISTAVSLESSQPLQSDSEPLPASFSVLRDSRRTPQPSVVRPPPGLRRTVLPSAAQVGYGSGKPSSSSAMKPLGVVEPWQKVDAVADMQAVWEKYEDVFYGDYQPLPSTHRRLSLPSLLQLLAAWTADKRLEQHVLGNETFADAFFRYLEEVYGCGNLASHVAHGCMLAFDEYLGQSKTVRFELHALAGLLPEPVRQYCTNIHCILMAQPPASDPVTLLRGLYPNARPQELARVAADVTGMQVSPEMMKKRLIEAVVEQVFAGRELRHKKWCEKLKASPHRRKEEWDREDFTSLYVHTFRGETDALATALCDAVCPEQHVWDASLSVMAYIMCCLDVAEVQYEDELDDL